MPVTINGSGPIAGVTSINTTVSDTELGYLDGTTSTLQTQISAKAADASQGMYLITPSSIANSGGSASLSGGAISFSGVTSISLNGVFNATYDNYVVQVYMSSASASAYPNFRMRAAGSDTSSAVYAYGFTYTSTGSTGFEIGSASSNSMTFTRFYTSIVTGLAVGLYGPYKAAHTPVSGFSTGNVTFAGWGYVSDSVQYDGLTLTSGSGSITGVVRVYGIKN